MTFDESHPMDHLLERYPPPSAKRREAAAQLTDTQPRSAPASARRLPIEAVLDLHGMTWAQAQSAIDAFLRDAARAGKRKVLLIHGKGSSPNSDGVLRKKVREYVESHPRIVDCGVAGPKDGGSGALWVAVAYRSR